MLLDPPLVRNRVVSALVPSAGHAVAGKRVVITGASSGVGEAAAIRLAALGAQVVLVARRESELRAVSDRIAQSGGNAHYFVCDLADPDAVDRLVRQLLSEDEPVDVLVNNAARSIRRPLQESFDRMHDFTRTMSLNYFAPVRLTLGLAPSMVANGDGHVINVCTWTVTAGTSPYLAAYHSSKAALAAFGRCLDAEMESSGLHVTTINYPLIRTAMSEPTQHFREFPALTAADAAEWIVDAVRRRPAYLEPRYALMLRQLGLMAPRLVDSIVRRYT